MATAEQKVNRQLKQLRADWTAYRDADDRHGGLRGELTHIDYRLKAFADQCGHCEGCLSEAYRRRQQAEIEARAAELKRSITGSLLRSG